MASRFNLMPSAASYPATGGAAPTIVNTTERIPAIAFDAGSDESAYWEFILPDDWTGTGTLVTWWAANSTAANADLYIQAAIQAITAGDAINLSTTASYDTANAANGTAPTTAYQPFTISVTLTNADGMVAGDFVRLKLTRDADNASDDLAVDALCLGAELRDAA